MIKYQIYRKCWVLYGNECVLVLDEEQSGNRRLVAAGGREAIAQASVTVTAVFAVGARDPSVGVPGVPVKCTLSRLGACLCDRQLSSSEFACSFMIHSVSHTNYPTFY